jgi:regulation of enolase protein 1 (concanavalin A-like superfamily)
MESKSMAEFQLYESFHGPTLDARLSWRCEPASWRRLPERHLLRVETDASTDFWQRTHYGFQVDNGHFLHASVAGAFQMETHVRFAPVHQYDQAGLMVRLSEACWIKTSVEYEPDESNRLGVVVTNAAYSDWSTQDVPNHLVEVWLRVERRGADYLVEASRDGVTWSQLRLGHLHADDGQQTVEAGLYACSPKAAGYAAEFSFLRITSL